MVKRSFDHCPYGGLRMAGHTFNGTGLLGYRDARYQIYLPVYKWLLEHKFAGELEQLRRLCENRVVVFFDYETNGSVENLKRPLSHASLVKGYLEGTYPICDDL